MDDHLTVIERAAALLIGSRFLVLATANSADRAGPWIATVNYVVSSAGTLLFCSAPHALHSQHIGVQPEVAVTVYHIDPDPDKIDGAQLRGQCVPVPEDELPGLHEEFFVKNFPDPEIRTQVMLPLANFQPGGTHQLYAITITECWVRDHTAWRDHRADRRLPIPIDSLITALVAPSRQ